VQERNAADGSVLILLNLVGVTHDPTYSFSKVVRARVSALHHVLLVQAKTRSCAAWNPICSDTSYGQTRRPPVLARCLHWEHIRQNMNSSQIPRIFFDLGCI
jgi:hypothetical protein